MRIAAASLIFLLASPAQAADDSAHKEAARRLAQVSMRFQDEDGAALACAPERASFGAELKRDYLVRPASFSGISPQSAYWPDVEEINYQYRLATCPISNSFKQGYADMLARQLTTADLDAAVAFYSSPVGQRLLAGMAKTGKEFAALGRATSPQKEAADLAYRNAMRELIAKYKAEPK